MITQDKIKIYIRYRGDIDSWARGGSKKEKLIMLDNDWYIISEFIQDFNIVKKGLASLVFSSNLNKRFKENCDSEETIKILKAITDE